MKIISYPVEKKVLYELTERVCSQEENTNFSLGKRNYIGIVCAIFDIKKSEFK
jgi:hypothetical protein